jgi:serine protease Do
MPTRFFRWECSIISPTGGSIGIGFAVPSDTATIVVDQLRQFGETRRGWLGVKIQSITDDLAEAYGVKENTGALVASVTPQSPAAKAGIQDGDVILKFDGKDVTTMRGLPRLVAQTPIGKDVDVELMRKGQRTSLKVAVGRLVEEDEPVKTSAKESPKGKGKGKDRDKAAPPAASRSSLIGLVLTPLNDELRTKHAGVNYRMLYFFVGTAVVVVSHGIKKERAVPPREIDRALRRRQLVDTDLDKFTFRPE